MQTQTISQIQLLETDPFRAYVEATYKNQKTVDAIHQHLRVFSLWYQTAFGEAFQAHDLTNYAVQCWRKHSLYEAKVKASTWNARLWALDVLVQWLEKPDLLAGVEAKEFTRGESRNRALTQNEYHRLMNTMETNISRALTAHEYFNAVRDWASASLMLHAGLRVDEVRLTETSDITINERSGTVRVRDGKGGKERIVDLNKHARAALSKWIELQDGAQLLFNGISIRTIQRAVKELGKQIGVPDLTCHWLRYTCAKMCEEHNHKRGLPYSQVLRIVQEMLGHKNPQTTETYLRSGITERQGAMDW
jgi:integrase